MRLCHDVLPRIPLLCTKCLHLPRINMQNPSLGDVIRVKLANEDEVLMMGINALKKEKETQCIFLCTHQERSYENTTRKKAFTQNPTMPAF